ncbi:hypothetical protein H8356DRAFT_1760502, partial [Neocallimastix lanati (nom. inval.)]
MTLFISAPCSTKYLIIFSVAFLHAKNNVVSPDLFSLLISAPWSIKYFTIFFIFSHACI